MTNEKTNNFNLRITPSLLNDVKKAATETGRTTSGFIRYVLDKEVKRRTNKG